MKPSFFKALLAACVFAVGTLAVAAPTPVALQVSNGVLTGASNVDVDGALYNVSFVVGSCEAQFNGCDTSSFAFHSQASAGLAAHALLDQVFTDSAVGNFDTEPSKIFGCHYGFTCQIFIPFDDVILSQMFPFITSSAINYAPGFDVDQIGFDSASPLAVYPFAVFELAPSGSTVPEPGSVALIGLALIGIAALRRRQA